MTTIMDTDTAIQILSGLRTECRNREINYRVEALGIAIDALREQAKWTDTPTCPECGGIDVGVESAWCDICMDWVDLEVKYRVVP